MFFLRILNDVSSIYFEVYRHFFDGQGDLLSVPGCRNGRDEVPAGKYHQKIQSLNVVEYGTYSTQKRN